MPILRRNLLLLGGSVLAAYGQTAEILGSVVEREHHSPVAGVVVRAVGIASDPSTASGEFSIKLDRSRIGHRVTLEVVSAHWVPVRGQTLEVIVPADAVENPIRIIVQRAGPPVASIESGGITVDFSVLDDPPRDLLDASYTAALSGPAIRITPKSPYLDLLRAGGPIYRLSSLQLSRGPRYPELDVKVVNNSNQTIFFTRAELQIETSQMDRTALLAVPRDGYEMRLPIENLGWGKVMVERVEFNLVHTDAPEDFDQPPRFTVGLHRDDNSLLVDMTPHFAELGVDVAFFNGIPSFEADKVIILRPGGGREELVRPEFEARLAKALGSLGSVAAKAVGRIVFQDPVGKKQQNVKFSAIVHIGQELPGAPVPIAARYSVEIQPEGANYVRSVDISQALKPHDFDRFTIGIAAPKSSYHRFRVRLVYNGGKFVESPPILLDLYNPRH